jgi:dihydroxyacetone kinase-like protein
VKEKFSSADLISIIRNIARDLIEKGNYLSELDSAVGDGDLGVTIALGMKAIEKGLNSLEEKDIGTILMQSGMNCNRAASSTFGTILATALIRAGKAAMQKYEIGVNEMVYMLEAMEKGIKERGKASVGDKTVLDALVPMRTAFTKAIDSNKGLESALTEAYEAAKVGVEKTKGMVSESGRSKWLGERSVGHPDPGAMAFLLMLESLIIHLKKEGS